MSPLTGLKMISFQFYKYIAPTALRKNQPPSPAWRLPKELAALLAHKQGLTQQLFPSATEAAACARLGKFSAVGAASL
jgi:hypothetical protein